MMGRQPRDVADGLVSYAPTHRPQGHPRDRRAVQRAAERSEAAANRWRNSLLEVTDTLEDNPERFPEAE